MPQYPSHGSVSRRLSSNRSCSFPASGSRSGFTIRHARYVVQDQCGTASGGFILPNDRVDVLLTRKIKSGGKTSHNTQTVLSNVRVLAIDQIFRENEKGKQVVVGKTATVELRPEQTELLEVADSMGALSLTLRSIKENSGKLGDDGPKTAKIFAKRRGSRGVALFRYGSRSTISAGQ